MKTKCMSCGGPTKKMQNGGLTTGAKKVLKQGPIKTIKTIRKAVNKITKPTTPKMELGGSLETFQFQNGGAIDSLKVIKKEGKLAVKTEKQKQAAAKKAAANAKKIAKAKENARLNLEWERMSESQKDSVIRQQRSRF